MTVGETQEPFAVLGREGRFVLVPRGQTCHDPKPGDLLRVGDAVWDYREGDWLQHFCHGLRRAGAELLRPAPSPVQEGKPTQEARRDLERKAQSAFEAYLEAVKGEDRASALAMVELAREALDRHDEEADAAEVEPTEFAWYVGAKESMVCRMPDRFSRRTTPYRIVASPCAEEDVE